MSAAPVVAGSEPPAPVTRAPAAVGIWPLAAGTLLFVVYTWLLSEGIAAMGMLWFMPAVIGAIAAALSWYAARLARRGVLR